jgi:hypothetical protein
VWRPPPRRLKLTASTTTVGAGLVGAAIVGSAIAASDGDYDGGYNYCR